MLIQCKEILDELIYMHTNPDLYKGTIWLKKQSFKSFPDHLSSHPQHTSSSEPLNKAYISLESHSPVLSFTLFHNSNLFTSTQFKGPYRDFASLSSSLSLGPSIYCQLVRLVMNTQASSAYFWLEERSTNWHITTAPLPSLCPSISHTTLSQ